MPAHWAVAHAIRDREPEAAESAMRDLLRLTAADIERALHTADRGPD
jgi:DNA-binding FadR family transcriptional regulator